MLFMKNKAYSKSVAVIIHFPFDRIDFIRSLISRLLSYIGLQKEMCAYLKSTASK